MTLVSYHTIVTLPVTVIASPTVTVTITLTLTAFHPVSAPNPQPNWSLGIIQGHMTIYGYNT